jgi:hypothetical protein
MSGLHLGARPSRTADHTVQLPDAAYRIGPTDASPQRDHPDVA